jgi:hypothetical protein
MALVFVLRQVGRRSVSGCRACRDMRLTMRAADGGYAARFLSFFAALGFSRFVGESTLPPTAANAHR